MWVKITKEIFEKSDFKSLNFLYQILSWSPVGSPMRYNIFIDVEKVKHTDNFKKFLSFEESFEEFCNIEYTNFVNSSPQVRYYVSNKKGGYNFKVEESILFFNQPVSIVLENNKNDSQFILAIITHFCKKEEGVNKTEEHFNNGWLQFENAGGCSNIPNFMEGFLRRFEKIAAKNNRAVSDYFRGIIIVDSDREYETQPSKHDDLLSKLGKLGVNSVHILQKRMMENYLPREVFEEIQKQGVIQKDADLKGWLDAYLALSSKQLDYINIADGFPPKKDKYDDKNDRKPVDHEILMLFSLSLSDVNFKKLDKGFKFKGFDQGKLKSDGSFKDIFPNLFRKSIVNKQNLTARDGNGELQEIANKIDNLL